MAELQRDGVLLVEDGNHGEYRPRRSEFVVGGGVPYIRAADLRDGRVDFTGAEGITDEALTRIRKGVGRDLDVLLTHKGTVGKVAMVNPGSPAFVCSPQTTFWRSLDPARLEPRFLLCALQSADFAEQLGALKSSTDMAPYVSLTQQRTLTVAFPPIREQRAIAGVLGALDDKIAANLVVEHACEAVISAMFSRAVSIEGSRRRPLFEVFEFDLGEPFKGEYFNASTTGRPLIRIRDIQSAAPQVWTTEVRASETVVGAGEVLVGMDAEFRPHWWLGEAGLLNQRVCRVRSRDFGSAFVREALLEPMSRIESYKTGTTVIHLNKRDLAVTQALVPEPERVADASAQADELLDRRVAAAVERRRLAAMRDALLPQLMSGKIRVKDAEQLVDEVL